MISKFLLLKITSHAFPICFITSHIISNKYNFKEIGEWEASGVSVPHPLQHALWELIWMISIGGIKVTWPNGTFGLLQLINEITIRNIQSQFKFENIVRWYTKTILTSWNPWLTYFVFNGRIILFDKEKLLCIRYKHFIAQIQLFIYKFTRSVLLKVIAYIGERKNA